MVLPVVGRESAVHGGGAGADGADLSGSAAVEKAERRTAGAGAAGTHRRRNGAGNAAADAGEKGALSSGAAGEHEVARGAGAHRRGRGHLPLWRGKALGGLRGYAAGGAGGGGRAAEHAAGVSPSAGGSGRTVPHRQVFRRGEKICGGARLSAAAD